MKSTIWCVFEPDGAVANCGAFKQEALMACLRDQLNYEWGGEIVRTLEEELILNPLAEAEGWSVEEVEVEG